MDAYRKTLEKDSDRHKLNKKLDIITACTEAQEQGAPDALTLLQIKGLNDKFDKEHTELEVHAEPVCRKKKDGKLPWTPESGDWWNRQRVYRRLVSYHKGENLNIKSLRIACENHRIPYPHKTSLQYALEGIQRCNDKIKEYTPDAWQKRRKFMTSRLQVARDLDDEKKESKIERIMMREDDLHTWGRLRCATKKGRCPPASQCAITDENGQQTVITGQIPFQNAVAKALDRQYHGANDAPINSGQLHQDIRYLAYTESAQALLRGDYKFPKDR